MTHVGGILLSLILTGTALPRHQMGATTVGARTAPDSLTAIYQAVFSSLDSYPNTQNRERLLDRRVLQWWPPEADRMREPLACEGSHDEELFATLVATAAIDGLATVRELASREPKFWPCACDTATAAISLSRPGRLDSRGDCQILGFIRTRFDFRSSRGGVRDFWTILLFILEKQEGEWVVTGMETIAIT